MGYNKIENGEITTAKELLLEVCPSYGVKIEDGVIQYRKLNNFHKKLLNEATQEYTEFQDKTDEEHQKYIDETFEKINQEREKFISYYTDKSIKYNNMIQQLKLWEHTKVWDNMCNQIMKELVSEYDFSVKMIEEYKNKRYAKETLEEYKIRTTKYYLKQIKRYSEDYANDIKSNEKNNQIIKEFEESLKELK